MASKRKAKRFKQGGDFCSALGCQNARNKRECVGKAFFRFPKDKERCKKWVLNMRRTDLDAMPLELLSKRGYKLCSDHFEDCQFNCPAEKRRLVWNAVPTLFPAVPNPPPKIAPKRPAPRQRPAIVVLPQKKKKTVLELCDTPTQTESKLDTCNTFTQTTFSADCTPRERELRQRLKATRNMVYRLRHKMGMKLTGKWALFNENLPTEHLPVPAKDQDAAVAAEIAVKSMPLATQDFEPDQPSQNSLLHSSASVTQILTSLPVPQRKKGCTEGNPRPEVKSEFRPSFLHSPAYAHWKRVGEQHGLHENEDIACFLLKYYEDTSKVFPSGLTVCSTCGRSVCVLCPCCKWTVLDLTSRGHPELQASSGNVVTMREQQASDSDYTVTINEEGVSSSGDAVMKEEGVDHDNDDDDCGDQSGLPSNSSGLLPGVQGSEAADSERDPTETATQKMSENSERQQREKPTETSWSERGGEEETGESHELEKNQTETCYEGCQADDDDYDDRLHVPEETMDEAAEIKVEKDIAVDPEMGLSCNEESTAIGSWLDQNDHKQLSDLCQGEESLHPLSNDKGTMTPISRLVEKKVHVKTLKQARQHSTTHSGQKCVPCEICSKTFSRKYLKKHKLQHTSSKVSTRGGNSELTTDDTVLCDVCGKSLARTSDFNKHRRIHFRNKKSFVCDICSKAYWTGTGLKMHKRWHTGHKPFMCDICGKTVFNLNKHQKVHSGGKSFTCDVCKAVFSSLGALNQHRASHTEKKPFACDMCSKSYAQRRYLWAHKKIHSSVRPFACGICGRSFYFACDLKYHKENHSRIRPFKCDVCCKTFQLEKQLTMHKCRYGGACNNAHTYKMISTHSGRPVSCEVCNKTFSGPQSVQKHQVIHTGEKPYVCDVCNQAFGFESNLRRHKRIHTGEKPFECDVCNKTFRQKTQVETHMRSHTGEKPYMCDVCSKRFTELRSLRNHKKIHLRYLGTE